MSLDDKIRDQYNRRPENEHLYNSVYSLLSDSERSSKMRGLLKKHSGAEQGTILEIGAGQGDNVPLMRLCGFTDDRIFLNELITERAEAAHRHFPGVRMYSGNAIEVKFDRTFNCVFQSTVFTSILDSQDRQALAAKMWDLLEPGGIILWYDFVYNNPSNRDVRKVSVAETKSLFPLAESSEVIRVTLAPPIGRRVGKLYNLFNVPVLRTHILAVFKKER